MLVQQNTMKMTKADTLLAALSASPGAAFSPVQIQKLIFLIDRNVPATLFEERFSFHPYDYGPFDAEVYRILEALQLPEEVLISTRGSIRTYSATALGKEKGEKILSELPNEISSYIKQAAEWVRRLSFAALVSSIYQAYPEMAINSVFQR